MGRRLPRRTDSRSPSGRLLKIAAESVVTQGRYLRIDVVVKERRPKRYRHPLLDSRLRSERLVQEARALPLARRAGVRAPAVLEVDMVRGRLVLERVPGLTMNESFDGRIDLRSARRLCRELGRMVGKLHAAGIIHGDLTTSNLIVSPAGLTLIDFGLSSRSDDPESQGADLLLLEHAFRGLHPELESLLGEVRRGYRERFRGAELALQRADVIQGRRRYA